jgi:uncharacterized membrane protein
VALRTRSRASFSALCLCCLRNLSSNQEDYAILHQDCMFIETGTVVVGGVEVLIPALVSWFVLGLITTLGTMLVGILETQLHADEWWHGGSASDMPTTAAAFVDPRWRNCSVAPSLPVCVLSDTNSSLFSMTVVPMYTIIEEGVDDGDLTAIAIWGGVLSVLPGLLVGVAACCGFLKRPYLHIGCNPGGGRGNSNNLGSGSASPFYIMLGAGAGSSMKDARTLAEWIRSAAILSRQKNIRHAKWLQEAAKVQRAHSASVSVADSVLAAHQGADMAHWVGTIAGMGEEEAGVGDVMGAEIVEAAEHTLMIESLRVALEMSPEHLLSTVVLVGFICLSVVNEIEKGNTLRALLDLA